MDDPDQSKHGDDSSSADGLAAMARSLRRIEELLAMFPGDTVKAARERMARLRGIVLEKRAPALALVGRRGAGKSSLINAMFGERVAAVGHLRAQTAEGRWYAHRTARGELSILDTRGVQEGSRPDGAGDESALDSVLRAVGEQQPDLVLFVIKASEVDSAIDADLDALESIVRTIQRTHRVDVQIAGILSHADLLEPKACPLHAPSLARREELDEKLEWVERAEQTLTQRLRSRPKLAPRLAFVTAVSSYLSFDKRGALRADERWRIDDLSNRLFRHLPDAAKATFARLASAEALRDDVARDLTQVTAGLTSIVAALPIPVADLLPITSLQLSLVAIIAWLGGRSLDGKAASEFLGAMGANVGAAFVFREGARALVKFVFPGAGSAISSGVAFAGTMAIGAAARAYFLRGVSLEDARKVFARVRRKEDDGQR